MENFRIENYRSKKLTALERYKTGIENENDEYIEEQKRRLKEIEKEYENHKKGFGYWFKVFFFGWFISSFIFAFIFAGIYSLSTHQDIYKCNVNRDKDCKKITQSAVILDDDINAD